MTEAQSRWECRSCGYSYESPVKGTRQVSHRCPKRDRKDPFQGLTRTWQSRWDKAAIAGRRS